MERSINPYLWKEEYQFCNLGKYQEEHNSFVQRIAQFQDEYSREINW